MKITKARLKQLIHEELESFDVLDEKDESRAERADVDKYEFEQGKEAGEKEKTAPDVDLILKNLNLVNTSKEAEQVLNAIFGHVKTTGQKYGYNRMMLQTFLKQQLADLNK